MTSNFSDDIVSSNSRFHARAARLRFFREKRLEFLVELMRLLLAEIVEPRLVTLEVLLLQRRSIVGIVDLVEFELEENEIGVELRQRFGDVGIELGARRVRLVQDVVKPRIGTELADEIGRASRSP